MPEFETSIVRLIKKEVSRKLFLIKKPFQMKKKKKKTILSRNIGKDLLILRSLWGLSRKESQLGIINFETKFKTKFDFLMLG